MAVGVPRDRWPTASPGQEGHLDFGRMGLIYGPSEGYRRTARALIFTAVYSRHMFVWLTFAQALAAAIAGCEAAWRFVGRIIGVLAPDNMAAIIAAACATNPRFIVGWVEYSQARGFVTDAARVRSTRDQFGLHTWCISAPRCPQSRPGAAPRLRPWSVE